MYLVSTGGDVRSQSLNLTVEDVVFLHLVLHRWQVLAKALVVQVVLGSEIKKKRLRASSMESILFIQSTYFNIISTCEYI